MNYLAGLALSLSALTSTVVYADSELFSVESEKRTTLLEPFQLSEYAVSVDLGHLGGTAKDSASEITLDLPEAGSIISVRTNAFVNTSGSLSWVGNVEGDPGGSVILVNSKGIVHGSIRYAGRYFDLTTNSDNQQVLREIDENDPALQETLPTPVLAANLSNNSKDTQGLVPDDGSVIDLLVVYTPRAATTAGSVAAVEARIDLGVTEANISYANSDVDFTVNLVHKAQVDYVEGADVAIDRDRLRIDGDGFLDEVHYMRDYYRADLVQMVAESNGCGIAYIMNPVSPDFEEFGFCVTDYVCVSPNYTFSHEMGHLQSARHDRSADSSHNAPFAFNHGYYDPDDQWRTVMSYRNCGGDPCTRTLYWSNPDINHPINGNPTGIAGTDFDAADNHLTLNTTRTTVANFRKSGDMLFVGNFN